MELLEAGGHKVYYQFKYTELKSNRTVATQGPNRGKRLCLLLAKFYIDGNNWH